MTTGTTKKVILVLIVLMPLLVIDGCQQANVAEAKFVFDISVVACGGYDPNYPWWQNWMLDQWSYTENHDGRGTMRRGEFRYAVQMLDTHGGPYFKDGIGLRAEVIGHWDTFSGGGTPVAGGPFDRWESLGYVDITPSDANGLAYVVVGLGDPNGLPGKEWPADYTYTYVDIKISVPLGQPSACFYLKAFFLDAYPGSEILFWNTMENCFQYYSPDPGIVYPGGGSAPSDGGEGGAAPSGELAPLIIHLDSRTADDPPAEPEVEPAPMDYPEADPNYYDPNAIVYFSWGRIDPNGTFEEVPPGGVYLLPIFYDPNGLDPETGWVDPEYADEGSIMLTTPYVARITWRLPRALPADPALNTKGTVFLRTKDASGHVLEFLPVTVRFVEISPDRMEITGITQDIVLIDSYSCWTVGHFGTQDERAAITVDWNGGQCDLDAPPIYADFDYDGIVGYSDFQLMYDAWSATIYTGDGRYDFLLDYNRDGMIGFPDFQRLLDNWGQTWSLE